MRVGGFTIIRNAITHDFPVLESISSLLPVLINETVFQYSEQPCLCISSLLKGIDKSESFEICVLDKIFCIVLIKGEPVSEVIHGINVGHELIIEDS